MAVAVVLAASRAASAQVDCNVSIALGQGSGLLLNGGFECGDGISYWTSTSSFNRVYPAVPPTVTHSGTRLLAMGNERVDAFLTQSIAVRGSAQYSRRLLGGCCGRAQLQLCPYSHQQSTAVERMAHPIVADAKLAFAQLRACEKMPRIISDGVEVDLARCA